MTNWHETSLGTYTYTVCGCNKGMNFSLLLYRFSVVNVLSQPGNSWSGQRGRINEKLLKDHVPPVPTTKEEQQQLLVCMCGPQPFTLGLSDIFMDMNYPEECIHLFT